MYHSLDGGAIHHHQHVVRRSVVRCTTYTQHTHLLQHVTRRLPSDALQSEEAHGEAEREEVMETCIHDLHVRYIYLHTTITSTRG